VGSLFFVAGSVLFYPALAGRCSAHWPCIMIAATLFICGSSLFWVVVADGLRRARALPFVEQGSALAQAALPFACATCFVAGSVFFLPAISGCCSDVAGLWLFIVGCALYYGAAPLAALRERRARRRRRRSSPSEAQRRRSNEGGVGCIGGGAGGVGGGSWSGAVVEDVEDVAGLSGNALFIAGCVLFLPQVEAGDDVTVAMHCFVIGSACFALAAWLHWRHESSRSPVSSAATSADAGAGAAGALVLAALSRRDAERRRALRRQIAVRLRFIIVYSVVCCVIIKHV
jgi:hypothetical protein